VILVDTSVWVNHLRHLDEILVASLDRKEVLTHPFVIGEMAMGSLRQREVMIAELRKLPGLPVVADNEVMVLVDRYRLFGTGIGYIDAHLLAAARLAIDVALWTHDRRLQTAATQLGIAAHFTH
jgi:hypothetical protein